MLQTGEPLLIRALDDASLATYAADEEHLALMRAVGFRSVILVPLAARGRTLGVLTLMIAESGRRYGEDDLAVARDLARRAGLAADNARLYHAAREAVRDRDRALAEAETERARLSAIFAEVPAVIIYVRGPRRIIEFANPRARHLFAGRDLVGRPAQEAVPEAGEQGFARLMDEVYASGRPFVGTEHRALVARPDGGPPDEVFFNFVYQPTFDAAGAVDGALTYAVDVTEQVRARQRIQELAAAAATERDRLQQIVDVLPEAILIADAAGRFIIGNAAATAILGRNLAGTTMATDDGGEVYGSRRLDGSPYPARELPLQRSVLDGAVVLGEQLLLRNAADGRAVPVLANSAPLRDAGGAIAGGVVVFQDIGAIKEMERSRDEFLASVSHDLKTPLTTIRGLAQLADRQAARLDVPEGERIARGLAGITAASGRMLTQINELLDVAQLQAGRPLALDRRPLDLAPLVRGAAAEQQEATRRHAIRVEAAVPALIVSGDALRLERVVANLLSNAIKYSPEGGEIALRLDQEEDGAGRWAVLTVRDRGIGIPAADLPRVFERFHRGGNVAGHLPGTGIGLASARQIVEQHGGTIAVASAEGHGAAFTVRLPLNED